MWRQEGFSNMKSHMQEKLFGSNLEIVELLTSKIWIKKKQTLFTKDLVEIWRKESLTGKVQYLN